MVGNPVIAWTSAGTHRSSVRSSTSLPACSMEAPSGCRIFYVLVDKGACASACRVRLRLDFGENGDTIAVQLWFVNAMRWAFCPVDLLMCVLRRGSRIRSSLLFRVYNVAQCTVEGQTVTAVPVGASVLQLYFWERRGV